RFRKEGMVLLRSSVAALCLKGASLVLVMLTAIVLTRKMGVLEYGRLAYIQSVAAVLAGICTLGFRESASRIAARYLTRKQFALLTSFVFLGISLVIATSTVAAIFVQQLIRYLPATSQHYVLPLWCLIALVITAGLNLFLSPVLVAMGCPLVSFGLD